MGVLYGALQESDLSHTYVCLAVDVIYTKETKDCLGKQQSHGLFGI